MVRAVDDPRLVVEDRADRPGVGGVDDAAGADVPERHDDGLVAFRHLTHRPGVAVALDIRSMPRPASRYSRGPMRAAELIRIRGQRALEVARKRGRRGQRRELLKMDYVLPVALRQPRREPREAQAATSRTSGGRWRKRTTIYRSEERGMRSEELIDCSFSIEFLTPWSSFLIHRRTTSFCSATFYRR